MTVASVRTRVSWDLLSVVSGVLLGGWSKLFWCPFTGIQSDIGDGTAKVVLGTEADVHWLIE